MRRYQDATAGAVAAASKGCVWNQDLPSLLEEAGLDVVDIEYFLAGTIASVVARCPR